MSRGRIVWVLVLGVLFFEPAGVSQAQELAIVGGTRLEASGTLTPDSLILIEGNRIAKLGKKGDPVPSGASILPADGKFILPGFIDGHIHYRDWHPPLWLAHGVTTVHDWNNLLEWILAQREAIEKGKILGPRILTAGASMDGPRKPGEPLTIRQRTGYDVNFERPEEAAAFAEQQIQRGVNDLKIRDSGRVTPELARAICKMAHRHGLRVGGHIAFSARDAADAGIDCLVHVSGVAEATITKPSSREEMNRAPRERPHYLMEEDKFDGLIDYLIARGVWISPTMVSDWKGAYPGREEYELYDYRFLKNPLVAFVPFHTRVAVLDYYPYIDSFSPEDVEKLRLGYRKLEEFVRRFVRRGGKLMVGSDVTYYQIPGVSYHRELELLVKAGLTPQQVLMATTRGNAEYFRLNDRGTIEAGKLADLVLLEANPLEDIRNTRKIHKVILNGKVIPTEYQPQYQNPILRPVRNHEEPSFYRRPEVEPILAPQVAVEGSPEVELTVRGSYFVPLSVVRFNGVPVPTTFTSGSVLKGRVSSSLLVAPGTYPVTVVNPAPGGGESDPAYFIVKFR